MKKFSIVTSSPKKFKDMSSVLKTGCEHLNLEIEEIQGKPEEIIVDKLRKAIEISGKENIIVDDTCLYFEGLYGQPGPYGKAFLIELGAENVDKLLSKLGRGLEVKSYIGVYTNKESKIFSGSVKGYMRELLGETPASSYGYIDNFFVNNDNTTTTAREIAIEKLNEYLEETK